jgi:MerR family transcriptional regulator, copper efflux regulator
MVASMNIGKLAESSGVNAKLIRHYESIGLLARSLRNRSGYRTYTQDDVRILKFVKRARDAGYQLKDIRKLLSLWENKTRANKDAKLLALTHAEVIDKKILELRQLSEALKHFARNCRGSARPTNPKI